MIISVTVTMDTRAETVSEQGTLLMKQTMYK